MYDPTALAVSPPPKSAALHSWRELMFDGADDLTGIVTFRAASRHQAGRVNTVAFDTARNEVFCDCRAGEVGHPCWHAALVGQSWANSPAMLDARYLTDAELARYGRKLGTMVAIYRERTGRALPADVVNLVAARSEYRRRLVAALASADLPLAA